jgi:hypothetical protein
MRFGVLGTGTVGSAVATKLVELGHETKMGSREAGNPKAREWAAARGSRASIGTFAEAAAFGEMVFNCTMGSASLEALEAAGSSNLKGKVLVDVANPLEFPKGAPPTLFTAAAGDSLAERIQKAIPDARVVKALNTVTAAVMGHPEKVPGETDLFIAGNDASAKQSVTAVLKEFGWKSILDLGDVTAARGTEAYLLLWVRLWGALGTPVLNVRVVH